MILGPADAAHFRVKVGRFGDRWYTDPLPGDDIAPATDATWPAFSIVKGASGKDWSYVTMGRIASAADIEWERMAKLVTEKRYDTLRSINNHGLDVAKGRGTILHWWGDDMLHGREPREIGELDLMAYKLPRESLEQAKVYLPAFRLFFDTYQPELVATEYPAIHRTLNGVGYGCTPDGMMGIEGDVVGYDFKSRTPGGDHEAYPEEGAQIAAGLCADYMIVEGEGGSVRQRIPTVTTGLVVSIKPDGVRLFPIDIAKAWDHFEAMHAWWVARRNERDAIGRPLPVRKKETPCSSSLVSISSSPTKTDTVNSTSTDSEALNETPLSRASSTTSTSTTAALSTQSSSNRRVVPRTPTYDDSETPNTFTPDDMTRATAPRTDVIVEGHVVDDWNVNALKGCHDALDPVDRAWIGRLTSEAAAAGYPISLRELRSERRYDILLALISWFEVGFDEDVIRDLLGALIDSDLPRQPGVPLGAVFGALTIAEALQLADMAGLVADGATLEYQDRWVITQTA